VIALHQSGVRNAVASLGTALTTEQIELLGRFTKNIVLVLIVILLESMLHLKVLKGSGSIMKSSIFSMTAI